MKVSVLVENNSVLQNKFNVKAVHGLSLYIEFNGKKILMDTGPDKTFLENAKKMNINISQIDYLIISHGHMDHGGGLKVFLEHNTSAKIYIHRVAINQFYTKILGLIPFYVGLNKKVIQKNIKRLSFIEEDLLIEDGIRLLTGFKGDFPLPSSNRSLYYKSGKKYNHDDFSHEILLHIKDKEGSVLFTACSHSGVINMLKSVKEREVSGQIKAVFGGFHLHNPLNNKDESEDYLKNLAYELDKENTVFYTGHCTGKFNFKQLKIILGEKIKSMNAGSVFKV